VPSPLHWNRRIVSVYAVARPELRIVPAETSVNIRRLLASNTLVFESRIESTPSFSSLTVMPLQNKNGTNRRIRFM
jgi:hypothetical protein